MCAGMVIHVLTVQSVTLCQGQAESAKSWDERDRTIPQLVEQRVWNHVQNTLPRPGQSEASVSVQRFSVKVNQSMSCEGVH